MSQLHTLDYMINLFVENEKKQIVRGPHAFKINIINKLI